MSLCSCGYTLVETFKFCPECGSQVSKSLSDHSSIETMELSPSNSPPNEYLQLRVAAGVAIVERYIGFDEDSVVIPGSHQGIPIDGIGAKAFAKCETLEHVIIHEGVRTIGDGAFSFCGNLCTITLPTSLRIIGDLAFSNCPRLEAINIPDGVISLGKGAFSNCTRLSDMRLPRRLHNLPDELFMNCKSLASVIVPKDVLRIGESSFAGCTCLQQLNLPDGLLAISSKAFQDCCALESLHVPKSTVWFGDKVFSQATFVRPDRRYNGWYHYSPLRSLTISCSPGAPIQAYARSNEIRLSRFAGTEPEKPEAEDRIFKVILYWDRIYGHQIDRSIRFDAIQNTLGSIVPARAYLDQIVEEHKSSLHSDFWLDLDLSLSMKEGDALKEKMAKSDVKCLFKTISE